MAVRIDIPGALRQLAAIRNRILELIEWDKLAQHELRPHEPPAFQLQTGLREQLREDVRSMHVSFISLASDIHEVLKRPDLACGFEDREAWRSRLERMDQEVATLDLNNMCKSP